jgi:molecular chaperone GrpE (heat shock protein)
MRKAIRGVLVLTAVALLFSVMTGCSKHPNEEQLSALEETNQAALSAERQLESLQAEKANVEKQLAEKKQQLDECEAEKELVSRRLAEKR